MQLSAQRMSRRTWEAHSQASKTLWIQEDVNACACAAPWVRHQVDQWLCRANYDPTHLFLDCPNLPDLSAHTTQRHAWQSEKAKTSCSQTQIQLRPIRMWVAENHRLPTMNCNRHLLLDLVLQTHGPCRRIANPPQGSRSPASFHAPASRTENQLCPTLSNGLLCSSSSPKSFHPQGGLCQQRRMEEQPPTRNRRQRHPIEICRPLSSYNFGHTCKRDGTEGKNAVTMTSIMAMPCSYTQVCYSCCLWGEQHNAQASVKS